MDDRSIFPGRQTVDLPSNLKRQFYPTLVLLTSLLPAYEYKTRIDADQPLSQSHTLPDLFRNFVSKLAFLCCTDPGSSGISACAVLKRVDDTIEYVFAFNKRTEPELVALKQGIEGLLNLFRNPDRVGEILRAVLYFNANRVKSYLKKFDEQLVKCIGACQRDGSAESHSVQTCLQELQTVARRALVTSENRCEVDVPAAEQLIGHIDMVYRSDVFGLVKARVSGEERNRTIPACWTELVHVAGRLKTYKQSIDVAHMAFIEWPELLESFEVVRVSSSACIPQVLNAKVLTAEQIMGKTTSDPTVLEEFKNQYQMLSHSGFNLDARVAEKWATKPKPIVHAEVQLHHWLENTEGGLQESRFFLGDKFIGSSKPPCRLCSYFFQEYSTDVEVRPSHRNVYLPWRMPDVYVDEGKPGEKRRQEVMHKIKARLRTDLAQVLREKLRDGRPHDSSNYSTTRGRINPMFVDGMSAGTRTSTPALSQMSRPVSSVGTISEETRVHVGEMQYPGASNARPSVPVNMSSMQTLVQTQWSTTGRAPESHIYLAPQIPVVPGASTHIMPSVVNQRSRHSRIRVSWEESDDDDGGTLLSHGRNIAVSSTQ